MTSAVVETDRGAHRTGTPLEMLAAFAKLGVSCFGGPIAHLGYFRAEFVRAPALAGGAGVRRPDRPPVSSCPGRPPARPASQSAWMRGGLLGRPRRLDRLHPTVGGCCWSCSPTAPNRLPVKLGRGAAARAEARGGRDRGAGGVGHGALALPGPDARLHRDRRRHPGAV